MSNIITSFSVTISIKTIASNEKGINTTGGGGISSSRGKMDLREKMGQKISFVIVQDAKWGAFKIVRIFLNILYFYRREA